jgi:AraC-like DNA-binding protein
MLGFAGWHDNQPYRDILFYTPIHRLFFVGPIVFFYAQRLLNPSLKFSEKEAARLPPSLLYLLYIEAIWIFDKCILDAYFFDKNPILLVNENQLNEEETIIDIQYETFEEADSPEISLWKSKIETLIQAEKLYQNPELTLTDLAKKLETTASVISKTINQGFQMNFNDCINNYRIKAVKKSFADGEDKKSTLLGIAFDSGFNSKATFNRAFKKNTGKTPKEFIETL